MPVGARYSPNTSRKTWPHSPVVTPAFAAAIEGSMMLRPSAAADLRSTSALRTCLSSRARRQAWSAARKRRGLGLGIGVDADQHLLALLDGLDSGRVGGDQRLLHVVDCGDGP